MSSPPPSTPRRTMMLRSQSLKSSTAAETPITKKMEWLRKSSRRKQPPLKAIPFIIAAL
eukprot:CAMPEP_0113503706 /NCGR_PEP_ID=MMETSP0014_2-20120614/34310_1 /TAXON_ID=2857 /ORGANISM="Nitzschia sp." /LENGTH=58 /DNA_ID=CAMNT_0000398737 /DNA_START=12 /DNA_END=185 /DNA_ORIENTATION=- /assembly_acc=CAM_ASM_000159